MSMVTCCPSCTTLFRVTPQQLQAHQGKVRCGRCMTVFDGFGALATLPEHEPPEPTASSSAEAVITASSGGPSPATGDTAHARAEATGAPEPPIPEDAGPPGEAVQQSDANAMQPAVEPGIEPVAQGGAPITPEDALQAPPSAGSVTQTTAAVDSPRRHASPMWSTGVALLVTLLIGQAAYAAYAHRVTLVDRYPELQPLIARLCDVLGCNVPLPQRPELINIEASDLQVVDPARPSVLQLTATLRNRAGYEVAYPALDLVLTNTKEHTLARRIFAPEEYLGAGQRTAGFVANREITVRLDLDTGDLGAAGFRLALLPAQSR